ncbi:MAG: RNA-binding transcriptional accessory protein [Schwartzia sp.]|nr:RNA-binding transcriptional accessory protein [Schwartzia sp. (in: firmicutes)]
MKIENIAAVIAGELSVKPKQVSATAELLDGGATVPFIARYRKEVTGELDETQIRTIEERLTYLRNLVARQEEIRNKIDGQGKLTPELAAALEKATKLQELEDIYLPYKEKRRTRATIAREKGLAPLAEMLLTPKAADENRAVGEIAADYIDEEKGVSSTDDAIAGAADIIAETISEDSGLRKLLRPLLWQNAVITTAIDEAADDELKQTFQMYDNYSEPVRTLPSHRVLAINRGEKKDALKVKLEVNHEEYIQRIIDKFLPSPAIDSEIIKAAAADSYKRLLFPALEREIRGRLTEAAEAQAINVFGANLRRILLAAPLRGYVVMALDPGYRTGCKMAVVDETGHIIDHGVLYVTHSDAKKKQSGEKVLSLIKKHGITLIAIGNGTASYETESFVAELIKENKLTLRYLIVNEAGASVYSASPLAKEEMPEYDVTIRGAVSLARRVQDPLAELIKIEPKAIGVGQYQHDVNQKELTRVLDATIESAVNHVGCDLNTASPSLLSHIAGISSTVAKNITKYRNEHGAFRKRRELLKVPRLGEATFTQCAGFLRIAGGEEPFDNTPIHPESYPLAAAIMEKLNISTEEISDPSQQAFLHTKIKRAEPEKLAQSLNAGLPTVRDILDALVAPGRDVRDDLPKPITRQSIVKLSDLKAGTIMTGVVQNVTDFGAFVDIGLKKAGLIHISELSRKRVKHPLDVIAVGDIIEVMVTEVDEKRGRIGLSKKRVPESK